MCRFCLDVNDMQTLAASLLVHSVLATVLVDNTIRCGSSFEAEAWTRPRTAQPASKMVHLFKREYCSSTLLDVRLEGISSRGVVLSLAKP
jgi:hypothetical protein